MRAPAAINLRVAATLALVISCEAIFIAQALAQLLAGL